ADDFWAVIDARGESPETLSFATHLKDAPWTEPAFHRLLQALASPRDELFEDHYQRAARAIDFDMLAAHKEELLKHPRLLPHVRDHLALRLDLADQPAQALWDRLMRHGKELGGAYAGSFSPNESDALIEALGRGGAQEVGPRALAILDDPAAA